MLRSRGKLAFSYVTLLSVIRRHRQWCLGSSVRRNSSHELLLKRLFYILHLGNSWKISDIINTNKYKYLGKAKQTNYPWKDTLRLLLQAFVLSTKSARVLLILGILKQNSTIFSSRPPPTTVWQALSGFPAFKILPMRNLPCAAKNNRRLTARCKWSSARTVQKQKLTNWSTWRCDTKGRTRHENMEGNGTF